MSLWSTEAAGIFLRMKFQERTRRMVCYTTAHSCLSLVLFSPYFIDEQLRLPRRGCEYLGSPRKWQSQGSNPEKGVDRNQDDAVSSSGASGVLRAFLPRIVVPLHLQSPPHTAAVILSAILTGSGCHHVPHCNLTLTSGLLWWREISVQILALQHT